LYLLEGRINLLQKPDPLGRFTYIVTAWKPILANIFSNSGLWKDYTQAIQYYDKALAIDPNYIHALNGKCWSLNGLEKYQEAIEYCDKALAIDPNYIYALNNKGNALNGLGNSK
jgi:tetratricopeptide (TPR) repeat protein